MDINRGGIQGFMSKDSLYCQQVSAVFIKVRTKGMPERMAGDAPRPSQAVFVFMDMPGKEKGVNRAAGISLLREEPSAGAAAFEPVLREDIEGILRQDGIPVFPAFGMRDVDPHIGTVDILITEMADFADAQAGRIHDGYHGFLLDVRDGGNEVESILQGRHERKKGIKFAEGELGVVPRFMEDVHGEEAEL